MSTTEYTPSPEQLRAVFQATAEAIAGDTYELWRQEQEDPEDVRETDWELSREWVADYISMHGGEMGRAVGDWIIENPDKWEGACDDAGVPTHWVA